MPTTRRTAAARRRGPLRSVGLVAAALLLAGGVAACGSSSASSTSSDATITLYSGQHQATTEELVAAFTKQTGIPVKVRYNDEDTFGNEIVTERSHPKADVFLTENTPVLTFLEEKGLLAKLPASDLAATPKKYEDSAGRWVGVSARVSVLVYNPSKISAADLPKTALSLASARYKGKVGFAPSETDFQPVVIAMERRYGKAAALAWLKGLKSNAGSHSYDSNEDLVAQINDGGVAFGLLNQYYWYRLRAELGGQSHMHSAVAYLAPHDPGYLIDVSGAAVLASSKHQSEADRFVAFLTSKAGQDIIVHSESFEYPIASGVVRTTIERPFSSLQPYNLPLADLGDGSAAVDLLREAGLQ